jgi:cholesterol oxidase
VGVLESRAALPDEDVPRTSWDVRKFAWQPEAEMYGIQRMGFLDDVLVLCGAGIGNNVLALN